MRTVMALGEAVGMWPARSVLVRSGAVPLGHHLGRRVTDSGTAVGDGGDAGQRPPIPFAADALGIHSGAQALARRVHPEASAPDRLDAHATAVMTAAVHEAGHLPDGPDVP